MARDYLELLKLARRLDGNPQGLPVVRVAVLGDHATQQLTKILQATLHERGRHAEIYEAEFDNIPVEILDPDSGLHRFAPEVVWLCLSCQQYGRRLLHTPAEEQAALPATWACEIAGLVGKLLRRHGSVVVNNLAPPRERLSAAYASVLAANRALADALPPEPECRINDVAFLATSAGLGQWYDDRLWVHSKYPCAPRHFPVIAEGCADAFEPAREPADWCLVCELDDTLWGGALGRDGMEGLEIGGLGVGEAYENFQRHLLQLKRRGFRLAVCSRCDEDSARRVFREHPGMVLRETDFAAFVAAPAPLADNLRRVSEQTGLDSGAFIFLDGSPAGRDEARRSLRAWQVPELPPDPAEYSTGFESSSAGAALLQSTGSRREKTVPADGRDRFASLGDYLESLEMKMACRPFDALHIKPAAQLLQHSNQFNLRTQEYSEAQCREFMATPERFPCFHFRLRDRLNEHGIIAVVCGEICGERFEIREWVMSCRVLNRGVEQCILAFLADTARERGAQLLGGEYLPTAKNRMVSDLYARLGFRCEEDTASGSRWVLDLATFTPHTTFIALDP